MKVEYRKVSYRKQRLEREIYKIVIRILGYQVKNPLISSMYVTRVELADNLQFAHVYVYSDDVDDTERIKRDLIAAGPFVQNRLNNELSLKRKVQVSLFFDEGILNQKKVDKILDSLNDNEEKFAEE